MADDISLLVGVMDKSASSQVLDCLAKLQAGFLSKGYRPAGKMPENWPDCKVELLTPRMLPSMRRGRVVFQPWNVCNFQLSQIREELPANEFEETVKGFVLVGETPLNDPSILNLFENTRYALIYIDALRMQSRVYGGPMLGKSLPCFSGVRIDEFLARKTEDIPGLAAKLNSRSAAPYCHADSKGGELEVAIKKMGRNRTPVISIVLLGIWIIFSAFRRFLLPGDFESLMRSMAEVCGLSRSALADWELWRLFLYSFVNVSDGGLNIFSIPILAIVVMQLEFFQGVGRSLAIFLSCGILGGLAAIAIDPSEMIVGSGILIAGFLGAMATAIFRNMEWIGRQLKGIAWRHVVVYLIGLSDIFLVALSSGYILAKLAGFIIGVMTMVVIVRIPSSSFPGFKMSQDGKE